jgi:hypothetical protein
VVNVVSLSPAQLDVTGVRAGDRNLLTIVVKTGGVPMNLTGRTITSQVRARPTDADPPALDAVVAIVDAVAGKLTIRWPGPDVAALLGESASYQGSWDLQVSDTVAGADPITVAAGRWTAEIDVTRP